MHEFAVFVPGDPATQGSKRYLGVGPSGKVRAVESGGQKLSVWRADIRDTILRALPEDHRLHTGPMSVTLMFLLARPRSHFRTGRNSHLLRESAPEYPAKKPDIDKLTRAALDAVGSTGKVWADDAQVVHLNVQKMYTEFEAGVRIIVLTM